MKFDLKKPCKDCPFIKEGLMNTSLSEGRMDGIIKEITHEDKTFQCHKTLPYYNKKTEAQHCAGALIYLEKNGLTDRNYLLRMAKGLNVYEPAQLELNAVEIVDKVEFEWCPEERGMVKKK